MCTASWRFTAGGFELHFNRDESVRRGRAHAPSERLFGALRGLAPTDADAGGTWIGVNERGLALALLNARDERDDARAPRSRGLLLRDLLASAALDDVRAQLAAEDLGLYRGFTLLALAPRAAPLLCQWDGQVLVTPPAERPLASSSLDGGRARAERRALYARSVAGSDEPTRAALERFHASHEPARGPWSPCMHRAEAATVSATEVCVEGARVALRYADGAPCTAPFGPWLELARR